MMADTDEKLWVSLEARLTQFEKGMTQAERRGTQTYLSLTRGSKFATKEMEANMIRSTRRINQALATTSASVGAFGKSMRASLVGPLVGIGAVLGTRELMRMADTWSDLQARVRNASGSLEAGTATMGRLTEMARRTYSGIEQTTESWLRNSTALTELGYSTDQQLDLTEALNNAMVISATKGQRAQSVMDAWGKAMALGKLSGENLNSVMAGSDRLTKALADSMGVSTTQLRKLGAEGKITTRAMYGVTSQLETLREEADRMPATLADAFQILRDTLLAYVGIGDDAIGISRRVAEAVLLVADNFNVVADRAVQLGFVISSALIARSLGGMLAAIPNVIIALGTLITALRTGTLVAAGFSAALGPIGLAAGAAAAALYLYTSRQTEAEKAVLAHEDALRVFDAELDNTEWSSRQAIEATRALIEVDLEGAKAALAHAAATRDKNRAMAESAAQQIIMPMGQPGLMAPPGSAEAAEREAAAAEIRAWAEGEDDGRADAAAQAIADIEERVADLNASERAGKRVYTVPRDGPTRLPASIEGDGKSGKSRKAKADEFAKEVDQIVERTKALQAEMAVQAGLNPLVKDYGYAIEKARAERELLLAAEKAGIAMTPQLREKVEALADAYARATAASAALQEGQQQVVQAAEEMQAAQRDVMGGFIKDLADGKNAADALADAIGRVSDRLLDMALDGIFAPSGGGGILGAVGGAFGFSRGTANTGGSRGQVRGVVHGQEAVIPLPSGGRVPVQIQGGGAAQEVRVHVTTGVSVDASGNLLPFVQDVAVTNARAVVGAEMAAARSGFSQNVRQAVTDPRMSRPR